MELKNRYRLVNVTDSFKWLYCGGFKTNVHLTRRVCRENGKFWVEWRVYAKDAAGMFLVGVGYTQKQARQIGIDYIERTGGI